MNILDLVALKVKTLNLLVTGKLLKKNAKQQDIVLSHCFLDIHRCVRFMMDDKLSLMAHCVVSESNFRATRSVRLSDLATAVSISSREEII